MHLDEETILKFTQAVVETRSFSKVEIEEAVQALIAVGLEHVDAGTLYLYLKRLEYGIKVAVESLKGQAFDALGYQLGGVTSGMILGAEVSISYPNEWHYSSLVADLKERQKEELQELQEYEKAHGIAHQVSGKRRITVTLRDKPDRG